MASVRYADAPHKTTLDARYVRGVLVELLGVDDERLVKLSGVARRAL
ncbi:MAG: hypothetical protein NXH85_10195 [Pseudomonadaceae bacterium]|nr:hypothetical protein [Pseudomonadaceae bacterium]